MDSSHHTSLDAILEEDEAFRNRISTVDESGKRLWVHPKKPSGPWHRRRLWVSGLLLALLFAGPFIRIQGQPLLLLNVFEREFVILGQPFFTQDFILLALTLITFIVFIIVFTVAFGRLFCGWACPQTIFMEMVFRKIEYWIDGDASQQVKLKNAPWNAEKTWKRALKYSLFLLISVLISHTFMAYLVGTEKVYALVTGSPQENPAGFAGLVVFAGLFFFVFSYMREQVCTMVCPYGRLQGVLLVKESIVVAYDYLRGEPRKRRRRVKKGEQNAEADKAGDCIDCGLCVRVCPTGIDIRNGTQMECVNCTACIDACDSIMEKIGKPKGLIRYASEEGIEQGKKLSFTPRLAAYSIVLVALLVLEGFMIFGRSTVDAEMLRVPGKLYQELDNGMYSNLYNLNLTNQTNQALTLTFRLEEAGSNFRIIGQEGKTVELKPSEQRELIVFVDLPPKHVRQTKNPVHLEVINPEGRILERSQTNFIGPIGGAPNP